MDQICDPSIAGRRLNLWTTRGVIPFSLLFDLLCGTRAPAEAVSYWFLALWTGPDLVMVVVWVWFCSLWKLVGSCHCARFLKWLVVAQPHLGLFASSLGPWQDLDNHSLPFIPCGHAPPFPRPLPGTPAGRVSVPLEWTARYLLFSSLFQFGLFRLLYGRFHVLF